MPCASKEIINGRECYLNKNLGRKMVRQISENMPCKLRPERFKRVNNAELRDENASQIGENVQVPKTHWMLSVLRTEGILLLLQHS